MSIYIQGLSALAYYRNGGTATEVERTSPRVRSLKAAVSSRREIVNAGIWRLGIGEPTTERPLEILIRDAAQRTRSQAISARIWSGPLAPTAFRTVRKDIYVSSPEFVFLQMATRLDLPELIALGMELCGTYRRNVELPRMDGSGITLTTIYQQQPLSNVRRLRGFVSSMKSARGSAKALKALQYVLPNSASPMETALYLLLCLPRKMGGYALPKPILNPPVVFSKSGRQHTLKRSAKPDLYWKKARLDLEYNSDEFHSENQRTIDSMRRKALERMRVEVIELTADELLSAELLHATALRIARSLKRRIRAEHEGAFLEARSNLRQMLLFSDTTAPPHDEAESFVPQAAEGSAIEFDAGEEPYDSTIWLDEAPDTDSWTDDSWMHDDSWTIDFCEWDDEGHVFGRGNREAK